MEWTWNRTLSALIAVGLVVAARCTDGGEFAFKVGMALIFSLACIWFGDLMGSYVGPTSNMAINRQSRGRFVCILGWVLLLVTAVPLIVAVVSK